MSKIQWDDLIQAITPRSEAGVTRAVGSGPGGAVITGVEYDSRRVMPGSVFFAMRGGTTDGNRFIDAAIGAGAAAVVTDSPEARSRLAAEHPELPALLVEHGRAALAKASAAFFGHPELRMHSTGVTGTNGKTTTAFLIEALLQAAGRKSVLVGTIEYHVAGEVRASVHTTPESRDLFALMAEGGQMGASELVMEVSSHALDQGRVTGVGFDVAVFTNLTRDHLDYHHNMESYFAAKRSLFDGSRYAAPRVAILNAGDEHSEAIGHAAGRVGASVVTYGLEPSADWHAGNLRLTPSGAEFELNSPQGSALVRSRLAGEVNVLNLLAALAAASARGVDWDGLVKAIPDLRPVPGRFQPVDAGQPFTVIVDYAHTDDALRNLTALARQLVADPCTGCPRGRVITLFGCGGDRDRSKRPRMGRAAGEGSDLLVVTSDNPRTESPEEIIAEILPGLQAASRPYLVEVDRGTAILLALEQAHRGDIVLIAGKGHEKQQVLANGTIYFDDVQVALSALRGLGYGGEL